MPGGLYANPPLVALSALGVYTLLDWAIKENRRQNQAAAASRVRTEPEVACPACDRALRKVAFHGVEIEECPFCGGQWFDSGELESISQMNPVPKRFLTVYVIDGEHHRPPGERPCPRCNSRMAPVQLGSVPVDLCSGCRGVWLDRGELKTVLNSH